jgi:DNA-binding protein YbaB
VEFESHPQATAALDEMKKFNELLEGALTKKSTGSFSAKDESETVEVVVNGDILLTQVYIEDGLLRLGAETVEDRINEALMKAQAQATASNDAMYGATFEAITGMLENMQKIMGE